jgi:hypothetical protein
LRRTVVEGNGEWLTVVSDPTILLAPPSGGLWGQLLLGFKMGMGGYCLCMP